MAGPFWAFYKPALELHFTYLSSQAAGRGNDVSGN